MAFNEVVNLNVYRLDESCNLLLGSSTPSSLSSSDERDDLFGFFFSSDVLYVHSIIARIVNVKRVHSADLVGRVIRLKRSSQYFRTQECPVAAARS